MSAAQQRKAKKRLRPGELEPLVLSYMGRHKGDDAPSASVIAKGVDRSSGAVANCLVRLKSQKRVRQTNRRPRRYVLKEDNSK